MQGDMEGRFSVYVHSRPGFLLNKATTRSPFFYGRQVNNSIQVKIILPFYMTFFFLFFLVELS